MGCPCTETLTDASFHPDDAPWVHIILVSDGIRDISATIDLLRSIVAEHTTAFFTLVDTSPESSLKTVNLGTGRYLAAPDVYIARRLTDDEARAANLPRGSRSSTEISPRFSWPDAVNAATLSRFPYTVYLHDDVTIPTGSAWLCALTLALRASDVGMAVPLIQGDCRAPAQSWTPASASLDIPYFPTFEPISGCCLATRTNLISGGWTEDMDGYEWHATDHQHVVAKMGLYTVVVPSVVVKHATGSRYPMADIRHLSGINLKEFCSRHGFREEFQMRPSEVRAWPKQVARHGTSFCFVVNSVSGVVKAREYFDHAAQLCLVDVSASTDIYRAWNAGSVPDGSIRLYQPAWDSDPVRQVISMGGAPDVIVRDFRDGSAIPAPEWHGKRVRIGDAYDLMDRVTELHVGMAMHYAIGDTLMMTPGFHAIKQRWPHVKIIVHHGWNAGDLLLHNPDVDIVERLDRTGAMMPSVATDLNPKNGTEGGIRATYNMMGLEDVSDRRIRMYILPEEYALARDLLIEWHSDAVRGAEKIAGVQLHGQWRTKQWMHCVNMIARLLDDGWWVVAMGSIPDRMPEIPDHPRLIRSRPVKSLRVMAAQIGLLDLLIGYDSGPVWAATAFGTPTIALFGPQDPRGYVADTEAPNLVCIRKRTPAMCKSEFGKSCREKTGGESCPLRDNAPGGLCLDDISVDDVLEVVSDFDVARVWWGGPLELRVPNA